MKIIYMGTPGFAVPPLKRLIESRHDVLAVVSQPDRPVGRGRKIQAPPVKELALAHNISVLQPEQLRKNKFHEVLAHYQPDIIVVVAYGRILPKEILEVARFGCINIHASLLPKYRGAAPIQWAVINGELHTGVTIMQLDEGMDTGNIIAFEQVDILEDDDTHSLSNLLSVTGGELLIKVLDQIEAANKVESVAQNHDEATHARPLTKADGLINWNLKTDNLIWGVRGVHPWPGAFSYLSGQAWKVGRVSPYAEDTDLIKGDDSDNKHDPSEPGTVAAVVRGKGIVVRTGDGYVLITEVQPPGKKMMSASDAVNGKLVKEGDLFISDPNFLEGEREES